MNNCEECSRLQDVIDAQSDEIGELREMLQASADRRDALEGAAQNAHDNITGALNALNNAL